MTDDKERIIRLEEQTKLMKEQLTEYSKSLHKVRTAANIGRDGVENLMKENLPTRLATQEQLSTDLKSIFSDMKDQILQMDLRQRKLYYIVIGGFTAMEILFKFIIN